ncbi:hypothetical protein ACHAQA_005085 [Verticillium albo-atrum]
MATQTQTLTTAPVAQPAEAEQTAKTPLQLLSQGKCLPGIPRHPTFAAQRQWLLEQMALAFRVFARKDYTDGLAGHISVRDPENPHTFWTDAAYLYGDAQAVYKDFGGVVLTEEEGERIGAALGPKGKGMILQNHGLLTVGTTVEEACFLMTLMERASQCQLLAEAAAANGLKKVFVPDASAKYTFENSSDPETLYWEGQPDFQYEDSIYLLSLCFTLIMDDLSGLDWSASSSKQAPKAPSIPPGANYYGSAQLNPSPSPFQSGRNTPLSTQSKPSTPPIAQSKPPPAAPAAAADSFSNLLNFGGPAKPNANLSLRERQERLEAEKRQKAEEKRKQAETSFGSGQFWDTLGSNSASRTASPALVPPPPPPQSNGKQADADDDLFAAFNKDTKVDNASHYPPPSRTTPQPSPAPAAAAPGLDLTDPTSWNKAPAASTSNGGFNDDDDPFGLNQMKAKGPAAAPAAQATTGDDDDFLGDLARPVEEVRRKHTPQPKQPEAGKPIESFDSSSDEEGPAPPPRRGKGEMDQFDDAVAQLVDYGFTPENARRGLTESGAGLNVQAAANWLLDDAHRQAKAKAQGKDPLAASRRQRDEAGPEGPRRTDSRSPAGGEDLSKAAAAVGSSVFKAANSFWKTSRKQVAQAYAEFNQPEGDPSQPKWMRSAQQDQGPPASRRQAADATDEAMMLDSGARPERRSAQRPQPPRPEPPRASSRGQSPAVSAGPSSGRNSPAPRWQQSTPTIPDSKARASKLAMEDDSLSSYVSPHRRKKATPQPQAAAPQEEPDLLFNSQAPKPQTTLPQRPAQASQPAKRPTPVATPRATPPPARQIPSISPAAIAQSAQHRLAGTQHFKRGDYASAHASYSSSLTAVPATHPLTIVILTNRALTSLKNGEPKKAVEDADAALKIIGPSNGQGEHVTVTTDTGAEERRDMRDLYAKALSRKAEALEQMERWADAGAVWQLCVQGGIGGPTAVAGRQRCQAALAPKPKPKPKAAAPARAPVRPRPAAATQQKSSEAVERLRKQNVAAAAEDDEKFALSEKVDARIAAWRDGKRENLRALLGSMDTVLWEGSGWKKVGLHELVMANKVKIVYMKAIAKCHPDKLAQDASTEVRLIAATVFATLNESWDKFKAENGL